MSGRDLIEVATPSCAMENKGMCIRLYVVYSSHIVCSMHYNLESSSLAQKIVATDTHYNNVRPLTHQYSKYDETYVIDNQLHPLSSTELLYLKRRNQLLQDNARHHEDTALRRPIPTNEVSNTSKQIWSPGQKV